MKTIFVWAVIDRFQKSSAGAKPAKRNSGKSWRGVAYVTNNDVTRIRVTAHDPQAYLDIA